MVASNQTPIEAIDDVSLEERAESNDRELKSASSTSTKIPGAGNTADGTSKVDDLSKDENENEDKKLSKKVPVTVEAKKKSEGKEDGEPEAVKSPASRSEDGPATTEKVDPVLSELKSAFPNIEEKYIKAVSIASEGGIASAFNALLYLSDPSFENEAMATTKQTAAAATADRKSGKLTQLEEDELLARELYKSFNKMGGIQDERAARERRIREREREFRRQQNRRHEKYEHKNSDIDEDDDDDFIEVLNRGLQETSKKVGKWWEGLKKNFNEEEEREFQDTQNDAPPQRQRRFNSFGARDDDGLRSSVYKMQDSQIYHYNSYDVNDQEAPPRLPPRNKNGIAEATKRKMWQPLPPEPELAAETKVTAEGNISTTNATRRRDPSQEAFLINSDDEL
ncbi:CUE domain-containing protein Ecym_5493 [Eremothecium cymbalariae DBVPG|uniref:CUE domain-containing protein n=1 Tax=Eremothecium cymbalariae (strain CBS 270.75 / DBVPG 7215 / KCTC 17166 / NRRL Y-17582) TaxID=931890 RepID=I6NDU5_ERECY|nr:hypothetical protein Ecym_5493 [Eremothecium cymbalariae DBVPG\